MNLMLNGNVVGQYHSGSQTARVLTENWLLNNMYCPRCGKKNLNHFENNRPVADFYCDKCNGEFELKSKNGKLGRKVTDGAYSTMIERITSNNNPDFFFLSYSKKTQAVNSLVIVPKHFFVPDIIEKRKPLSDNAKRAGWVGCNILLNEIPEQGRIAIIANGVVVNPEIVINKVNRSLKLELSNIESRGWLFDIVNCVNNLPGNIFSLKDMYKFENILKIKHPNNNNIQPKIRQQLQFLRDKGFIEFLGNGMYRKI